MRIQFRCAAGEIERAYTRDLEKSQHCFDGLMVHRFSAGGSGIDMAMQASLIALISKIDLQRLQTAGKDNSFSFCSVACIICEYLVSGQMAVFEGGLCFHI